MADHIVTTGGDSGAGMIIAVVLAVALVLGGIWLFNSGALNTGGGGTTVQIETPAVTVPAAPAPAPAN